ncbi:MAG TPA: MBL fold metallo-hydrolase [Luteibacter sp.]|jgi:cyclase|nr:MBL fold metallo-hydrolase [Luteibacter sp.]
MRVERIEDDIWVYHGDCYESVATAFVHNGKALLIDALASDTDAEWMRAHIERELDARVRLIVMTHYMSDHMAALCLFPDAQILAHRYYMHTYLSQRQRSVKDDARFIVPTTTFSHRIAFDWGRHTLRILHNPGKTLCATAIDVPDCDLLLCGDALVGNTAYIGSSAPGMLDTALENLGNLRRSRVVPGHIGMLGGDAFANARHYLARLGELSQGCDDTAALHRIRIQDCLAPGLCPVPFEEEWHGRNLDVIAERRVFAVGRAADTGTRAFDPRDMGVPV